MPAYAVVDAIVAFDRFRNVDLVQQGFYRISVRMQAMQSGTSAVPLACCASDRSGTLGCDDTGEPGRTSVPGMQSFLDSREKAYVTRPFYVRYNDHTACLCELAHFRLELDCAPILCLRTGDVIPVFFEQQAEIVVRDGAIGLDSDRLAQTPLRAVNVPLVLAQEIA